MTKDDTRKRYYLHVHVNGQCGWVRTEQSGDTVISPSALNAEAYLYADLVRISGYLSSMNGLRIECIPIECDTDRIIPKALHFWRK